MKSINKISLQLLAVTIGLFIATDSSAAERKAGYYLTKQQQVQADKIAAANKAKAGAQKSAGNKNMAKPANSARRAKQNNNMANSNAAAGNNSDSESSDVGGGGFDMFGED